MNTTTEQVNADIPCEEEKQEWQCRNKKDCNRIKKNDIKRYGKE